MSCLPEWGHMTWSLFTRSSPSEGTTLHYLIRGLCLLRRRGSRQSGQSVLIVFHNDAHMLLAGGMGILADGLDRLGCGLALVPGMACHGSICSSRHNAIAQPFS